MQARAIGSAIPADAQRRQEQGAEADRSPGGLLPLSSVFPKRAGARLGNAEMEVELGHVKRNN